ncbi:MAG: response regulator [Betaproteobacteria bacterium]
MGATDKTVRILVVDDYESMRKIVIKNLNQMGYLNIVQASNGQEALRALESNAGIQIIVTDWNMPVMPGIEFLRAVRAHPKFCNLPVLMITAEIARHQVQEAAEAGVSDFLVKPFSVGGLQGKFDKILNNLKIGKVVGAPGQNQMSNDNAGLPSALFAKRAAPAAAPAHQPVYQAATSATQATRPVVSPAVGHQPSAGEQPLALVITEDLQARMTKHATILVIDDIVDNIDVLVGLLQDEYKVRTSKSGIAALKMLDTTIKASQPLPDLILLDVMMPEMDGFEVCRQLKANPATAGIPVIFLSAADDVQNVVQGLELGAVDYVTKPANPTVLKIRVKTHLTRTAALQELQKQNQVLLENMQLREEVEQMTRHDLKNPIGGIMNFSDLLLADESLTADQRDIISTIGDSARLVLNMVNLSLDLGKIEQGTYELQASPINLVSILRRAFSDKSQEMEAKNLKVVTTFDGESMDETSEDIEFRVLGDELLCYSSFGNLAKNAVEAAPDGSAIAVNYQTDEAGYGNVSITNGGVVPEAVRQSFFDKFVTAGKKGGTGLGTYSARLLTEVQNGRIEMQTSEEKGETTLKVSLPLV